MKARFALAAILAAGLAGPGLAGGTQGVSDTAITFGSVTDLSGIFAAAGVPASNGANMRFAEANAAGGVHGRQINLIVEDNAYQLPRTMQALNKLINRDRVFGMMLSIGTSMNLAAFKLMDPMGMPNVVPMAASTMMLADPMHNKFVGFSNYLEQATAGVDYLHDDLGVTKFCAMTLPTDFGEQALEGTHAEIDRLGLEFVGETTHKGDEADFTGSLAKLNDLDCKGVVLALGVRQIITVVGTAKKMGLDDMHFFTTSTGFFSDIAAVPGGVTDGLIAAAGWVDLVARQDDPVVADWMAKYEAAYGDKPNGFALIGYAAADQIVRALEVAGPDVTYDSFIAGMETLDFDDPLMGNHISYGPEDHTGADGVVISVVKDGVWDAVATITQ